MIFFGVIAGWVDSMLFLGKVVPKNQDLFTDEYLFLCLSLCDNPMPCLDSYPRYHNISLQDFLEGFGVKTNYGLLCTTQRSAVRPYHLK